MESEILFIQYELIAEARQALFDYCRTLTSEHFTRDLENFGGRSIRYLLVHTSNTYRFWLGHFPQLDETEFVRANMLGSIENIKSLYDDTNKIVSNFLRHFQHRIDQPILGNVPKRDIHLSVTPLQLFTHVITHEYHHKGQMMSMSRQLGYTPVDTDMIRF